MPTAARPIPPLIERLTAPDGSAGLRYNFHPGQLRAWHSGKRVVAVIAGGRSGKTVLGPLWLHREMVSQGPGDYLVAAPTYPLLDKAAAPEVQAFFGTLLRLGRLQRSPLQFRFSDAGCVALWGRVPERPPRILFAHAGNPEGLEAMSAKAAWLDEAGQAGFKLASWEAVQQRLSIDQGRCLITSKPFNLGWLKQRIYDPWQQMRKVPGGHPDLDVINFGSADNPVFPKEELERARRELPGWKLRMMYYGLFERPAGLIYDCYDPARHDYDPFDVPPEWERYGGLDFGGVNTAAVMIAKHPRTGQLYLYREYHRGHLTAKDHVGNLLRPGERFKLWAGGSKSEGHWRHEFAQAGMPVCEPAVSDVEVGIGRVYALLKSGRLVISKACEHLRDDLASYSRPVDDEGEPLEGIMDKEQYHVADACRYVCSYLHSDAPPKQTFAPKVIPSRGPTLGGFRR